MLIIRREQLDALQSVADDAVAKRVAEHLLGRHAPLCGGMAEDELLERARYGVRRARGHGLERECDVGAFVALMFAIGPDFDRHPRIAALLAAENVAQDDRIAWVTAQTTEREWKEAKAAAGAWPRRAPA